MFSRSDIGLSNLHLILEVEIVVFCEGRNLEERTSSLDEVFWEQIFRQNGKHVCCRSVGGKSELLELARKVADGTVQNTVVAFDRDYDDLLNKTILHPRIIYTYGYSWESDVIKGIEFSRIISLFITVTREKQEPAKKQFQEFWERQSENLRRVFALDFKYYEHEEGLFDRKKPVSIIETADSRVEPYIKIGYLLDNAKQFGKFQSASMPPEVYKYSCGMRRFFGKTTARLVYHWFVFQSSRMDTHSRLVEYKTFMNTLIDTLDTSDLANPRNAYYSEVLSRL